MIDGCLTTNSSDFSETYLYSEDGTSKFRRNIGTDLSEHEVSRPVGLVMEFCIA